MGQGCWKRLTPARSHEQVDPPLVLGSAYLHVKDMTAQRKKVLQIDVRNIQAIRTRGQGYWTLGGEAKDGRTNIGSWHRAAE